MNDQIGTVHQDASALGPADRALLEAATDSQQLAYAPYSRFVVGAALRTSAGHIVQGANQENASYSLCICGERVALFNKAIHYPGEAVDTLAICVSSQQGPDIPAPPCGACLQVINEFEYRQQAPIRILLKGDGPVVYEIESVQKLMPLNFDRSYLDRSSPPG
ncbi:MAG: cytidine deaminase [Saprospiraceae bacterium]|nr:cytidine deaminase [Saprospiraceae bacterium]